MVSIRGPDPRRYPPGLLVGVATVALALLLASFFFEARVVLERPNYGNVTGTLLAFWRVVLGTATVGSFVLAVYRFLFEEARRDCSATGMEIRGRNHDIDVHLHLGGLSARGRGNGRGREASEDDSAGGDGGEGDETTGSRGDDSA